MIDHETFESYSIGERNSIVDAMTILRNLGVFKLQVARNSQRLIEGFQDANPRELAEKIIQVQQTNRNLLALDEAAGTFKKEEYNAS